MPKCQKEGCNVVVWKGYCQDHAKGPTESFEEAVLKRLDRIAAALEAMGRR